eukprot:TRINITY_DN15627_c0_g1_i1.p1 TRINITY_DN15627_c0_g1~~TRINITY_DN15627_c0_g1_i1.p1  ORF type:complete len:245 (-),score=45.51 TRINITY_DN15627_c0_g1_i1:93-827(-)
MKEKVVRRMVHPDLSKTPWNFMLITAEATMKENESRERWEASRNFSSSKAASQGFYYLPAAGETVTIDGARRRPDLYGKLGKVVSKDVDDDGFIRVRISGGRDGDPQGRRTMKVRPHAVCRIGGEVAGGPSTLMTDIPFQAYAGDNQGTVSVMMRTRFTRAPSMPPGGPSAAPRYEAKAVAQETTRQLSGSASLPAIRHSSRSASERPPSTQKAATTKELDLRPWATMTIGQGAKPCSYYSPKH